MRKIPIDAVAAALTCTSTVLLAFKVPLGFAFLAWGSVVWLSVALQARLGGRPVWGQALASAWTFGWAVYGFLTW